MGIKAIPAKLFREFLKSIGCEYKRTKGDHEIWDKKDGSLLRPIVFKTSKKEIPLRHIHTNLITLEMSHQEFEDRIKKMK
ncbi:MAG: hypothetical protein ABR936_12835 [Bacteroidota bacterium]|jgi:hypothetical protein